MRTDIQERGRDAERIVADYLIMHGYTICARNYVCRSGEIDIIARKLETIAFVEVKMRTKNYFNLSLVVDRSKQKKIITTALHYAAHYNYTQHALRFDVALVGPEDSESRIMFIPNAFTAPETL